jgi:hypothetical protein
VQSYKNLLTFQRAYSFHIPDRKIFYPEKDHWGDPGVDGRIILRWIIRKWDVGVWTGMSWLRTEKGGGHL